MATTRIYKDGWHKMAIQAAQCLSERVEKVRKK